MLNCLYLINLLEINNFMNNEPYNANILIDYDLFNYLNILREIFNFEFINGNLNNPDKINYITVLEKNNLFIEYFVFDENIIFNNIYKKSIEKYSLANFNTIKYDYVKDYEFDVNIFCTKLINDLHKLSCTEEDIYFVFSKLIKYIFSNDQNNSIVTNPKIDEITFENLYQLSNIIIYFISLKIINPVTGSILIAEVWPLISYDLRLNNFIGREIEIFELQNKIKSLNPNSNKTEIEKIENEISNIKKKIIIEAEIFTKINLS